MVWRANGGPGELTGCDRGFPVLRHQLLPAHPRQASLHDDAGRDGRRRECWRRLIRRRPSPISRTLSPCRDSGQGGTPRGFRLSGRWAVLHDINGGRGRANGGARRTNGGREDVYLNLIARFKCNGAVLIDGIDVRDVANARCASRWGLSAGRACSPARLQTASALGVRCARQGSRTRRAWPTRTIHQRLPGGYATTIQEGGVSLSLGQRQLVCIAAPCWPITYPDLDEATSSVDTVTEGLIRTRSIVCSPDAQPS